MSQLNQILERIANIQININLPGAGNPFILDSEPYLPRDMSRVQLPFFVNDLRGGPADIPVSAGEQYRTTFIRMILCYQNIEQNIDLKYTVRDTAQWVDVVFATFAAHHRLSAPATAIKSSTNANPIQITTGNPHSLTNGDSVTISGHLVNTNANGVWIATVPNVVNPPEPTVPDKTHFTIPVAGNGVGGATGTIRKTQPYDMPFVVSTYIKNWDMIPFAYGSTDPDKPNYLALMFNLQVDEMFSVTITE